MNINSINFIKEYCDFTNPEEVWILKGISRNKDNPNENMHRFMRRLVMSSPNDIEQCYKDIRGMGNQQNTSYRMYISLNSRNTVKGLFQFQKKLLDISYDVSRGIEDAKIQTIKLHSLWKTELEQKGCRGTKRVLLDVDNDDKLFLDKVITKVKELNTKIHVIQPTVTGYAVVIEACDMRPFYDVFGNNNNEGNNDYIDVQRDSMVFVEKWDGIN